MISFILLILIIVIIYTLGNENKTFKNNSLNNNNNRSLKTHDVKNFKNFSKLPLTFQLPFIYNKKEFKDELLIILKQLNNQFINIQLILIFKAEVITGFIEPSPEEYYGVEYVTDDDFLLDSKELFLYSYNVKFNKLNDNETIEKAIEFIMIKVYKRTKRLRLNQLTIYKLKINFY